MKPEVRWNEMAEQWEADFGDGQVVATASKDHLEELLDFVEQANTVREPRYVARTRPARK